MYFSGLVKLCFIMKQSSQMLSSFSSILYKLASMPSSTGRSPFLFLARWLGISALVSLQMSR